MPRSPDAEQSLADARAALARGALAYACASAWRAAAAAAKRGDDKALAALAALAPALELQSSGRRRDDAARLRSYVEACLEDARKGTRRPSAVEQMFGRNRPR
jgi:hypothetical protein